MKFWTAFLCKPIFDWKILYLFVLKFNNLKVPCKSYHVSWEIKKKQKKYQNQYCFFVVCYLLLITEVRVTTIDKNKNNFSFHQYNQFIFQ